MIHIVKPGETLGTIAVNYRTNLQTLQAANPRVTNPYALYPGQKIIIPGLPEPATIPYTIVVSLSKRRLTLLRRNRILKVYPIAIGKILSMTPLGNYVIVNREPNPGGPYGVLWLSLSRAGYGIHGTNKPSSIGKAVSKGCIRMYNQDVLNLGSQVPNGTRVRIVP